MARWLSVVLLCLIVPCLLTACNKPETAKSDPPGADVAAASRDIGGEADGRALARIRVTDPQGRPVTEYATSRALLIGASHYRTWPQLATVPGELSQVEQALTAQGFLVERVDDPDGEALEAAFDDFIKAHGYDPDNRLLFFYSGHGHTLDEGRRGYLVPVDAPHPGAPGSAAEREFRRRALDMGQILAWSRQMTANHALFLFDACFAGTIFAQKNLQARELPRYIQTLMGQPVRQFITAGQAGEPVPAQSVFTPAFVQALRYGQGDGNRDGYLTGMELGLYLQQEVPRYTAQTPQYGKIKEFELAQGDFIFALAEPEPPPKLGDLLIQSRPAGASITLDGEPQDQKTPLRIRNLPSGKTLTVTASKPGHREAEERVYVRADQETSLTLALTPIPTTGRLSLRSTPSNAKWFLDGTYMGRTPETGARIEPGRYRLTVQAPEHRDWERTVNLAGNEQKALVAELPALQPARYTEATTGLEFVRIEKGCFQMGSPESERWRDDDERRHRVCIKEDFYMGTTEVTFEAYDRFARETGQDRPDDEGWGRGNRPVINVSWHEATAFAQWLSQKTGQRYRLPTEAEWEYAARAGTQTAYWWGNEIGRNRANCDGCGSRWDNKQTAPVGSFAANPWGLYDTAGNVWEWTCSAYVEEYDGSENACANENDSGRRALRGGSWGGDPQGLRSANRIRDQPENRYYSGLGFRLARTLTP